MRTGRLAMIALCAIGTIAGGACKPKSGGFTPLPPPFAQAFLPIQLSAAGGPGDVSFEANGDLIAVDGSATVHRVAKADGSVGAAALAVGGGATVLRSVQGGPDQTLYAGDAAGNIYVIDETGASSVLANTGADPVTGLAIAPNGFGDHGGSIVAALGPGGIVVVDPAGEPPSAVPLSTAASYVDLAFDGLTLYALDATGAEIDTIALDGVATSFAGGFVAPVGLGIDPLNREIVVADAGDDVLRSSALDGGAVIDLAPYDFSPTAPSGIAFDGSGAIAFVTAGSVVVRGATVPPLQPAFFGFSIGGTTVGYGDLEFDRIGQLLALVNDDGDPGGNFLILSSRNGVLTQRVAGIGAQGEDLLALAFDAASETAYVGTLFGNVFAVDDSNQVTLLVAATGSPSIPVLGLEIAPAGFGGFGGQLVATTSDGEVLTIDPANPVPTPLTASPITTATTPSEPAALPSLVFSDDGLLYVLDSGVAQVAQVTPVPRILEVSAAGVVTDLGVDPAALGLPDGLAIDDGGERLLVASVDDVAGDRLLAVDLLSPAAPGAVSALQSIDVDDGFFPTGVVYDRLGRAAVLGGSAIANLQVVVTFP